MHVADFGPQLKQVIMLARQAGLTASAAELEERASAVCTTSSEFLAQVGGAILQFRSREGKRVPAEVADLLDECLREVGKVWPKFRPGFLGALLRRIDQLRPR